MDAIGQLDMFDLIVQHDPTFAPFMEVGTLKMLAIVYHNACEKGQAEEQKACDGLHRFLDCLPQAMVEKHLYHMQGQLVHNTPIVERVANIVAQQQKQRLKQNVQARVKTTEKSRTM